MEAFSIQGANSDIGIVNKREYIQQRIATIKLALIKREYIIYPLSILSVTVEKNKLSIKFIFSQLMIAVMVGIIATLSKDLYLFFKKEEAKRK